MHKAEDLSLFESRPKLKGTNKQFRIRNGGNDRLVSQPPGPKKQLMIQDSGFFSRIVLQFHYGFLFS